MFLSFNLLSTSHQNLMIAGLDFTSRPSPRKKLWLAVGSVSDAHIRLTTLASFLNFDDLADAVRSQDIDILGCDFPFALPSPFLLAAGIPTEWSAFREWLIQHSPEALFQRIDAFRASQPVHQKLLFRPCDRLAKAISPMMLVGVPVAKMLYQGLVQSQNWDVSIAPCEPGWQAQSSRIAIEVYPALVARALQLGRYKTDRGGNSSTAHHERSLALERMQLGALLPMYGIRVELTNNLGHLALEDGAGDALDAIFALIQATWASRRPRCGIPAVISPDEGWIVDPVTANFRPPNLVEP